jgi:hypothetical protein
MNFYKLNKLINEMAPPAVGLQQPMATNSANDVTPGQNTQQPAPEVRSKQQMNKNLAKISSNLGEKGNKYQKLIQFVGRNPEMLALLDDLLGDVGGMQGSKFGNIYK